MSGRYVVEAWVPPGVLVAESREYPTFDEMVVEARRLAAKYPTAVLDFGNVDRADIDTRGLSEAEEEALANMEWQ